MFLGYASNFYENISLSEYKKNTGILNIFPKCEVSSNRASQLGTDGSLDLHGTLFDQPLTDTHREKRASEIRLQRANCFLFRLVIVLARTIPTGSNVRQSLRHWSQRRILLSSHLNSTRSLGNVHSIFVLLVASHISWMFVPLRQSPKWGEGYVSISFCVWRRVSNLKNIVVTRVP